MASTLAGVQSVGVMHSQVLQVLPFSLTSDAAPVTETQHLEGVDDNTAHISMHQDQLNYYRHQELSACHSIVMCVFHNHLITTQHCMS
jgi:hypothetical protein